MANTDTERYVRITLLTFEGGLWIGKKILFREIDGTPGPKTLDTLLFGKKSSIDQERKRNKITSQQYEALFPTSGDDTDVDEWDLSLIIKIVKLLFQPSMPSQDSYYLNQILKIRNEVVCHAKQPSIREQEFDSYWTTLSECICDLASAFDEKTKRHADELVEKLRQCPLDLQSSVEKVGQLCRNDENKDIIMASLAQLGRRLERKLDDANRKLDDVLAQLIRISKANEGEQCRIEIPMLDSTVCLSGKREDVVKLAKDILLKVLRCAIEKVEDRSDDRDVRHAVEKFLADIENNGGHTESAETGSIILKIRCTTLHGLINMLDLFRINSCRYRLVGIEKALKVLLQDELKVELVLPEDTVDMIKIWTDRFILEVSDAAAGDTEPEYRRTIHLGIRCDTAEAAVDVVRYLHSEGSTNRLNTIAETMSQALGDHVKIEAVPDVGKFTSALCAGTTFEASQRKQDECAEDVSAVSPEEAPTSADLTECYSKDGDQVKSSFRTDAASDDCLRTIEGDLRTEIPPSPTGDEDQGAGELDLNGYRGKMNAEDMRNAVLERRSSLTKLTIGRVDLSSLGNQLCDVISLERLEDLAMRSLTFSHEQYQTLGSGLQRSPQLRKLILCNISCKTHGNRNGCVDLDLTGPLRLQDVKLAVLPVTRVDLNPETFLRCDIQLYDNVPGQTSVLQNLMAASNLQHFTCVDVGDTGAVSMLVNVLTRLDNLQTLELFQIDLSSVTEIRLSAKIESVELHYCKFDFMGLESLLHQLNLSQKRVEIKLNNITIKGEDDLISKIRDSPNTNVKTDRGVEYREGEWKVAMFNFYMR